MNFKDSSLKEINIKPNFLRGPSSLNSIKKWFINNNQQVNSHNIISSVFKSIIIVRNYHIPHSPKDCPKDVYIIRTSSRCRLKNCVLWDFLNKDT